MNIGVITSRYPSKNSPYNHMFVHVRALEMIRQGHAVTVYVPGEINLKYNYQGVDVNVMSAIKIVTQLNRLSLLSLHLLNIYPYSKKNGWIIYKYLLNNEIPIVLHIHGNEVQKYRARMFEFNYKITDFLRWFKKDILVIPKMRKFINKTINKDNVAYVFPSLWMKEETQRNLKIKITKKYEIIPTGIESDFFHYKNSLKNRFKMISIRSLSNKVYDIEKTIEVLSLLPDKYTLDIYGKGVYKSRYELFIKQKDLESRINIVSDFVEKKEMKELFSNYGIYISTTKMDSQGVNMMEAMASGLLVATTDNSSKREFITNLENGVLGKNAIDIAANIRTITNDKDLFIEVTQEGRKLTEYIDISKTVEKELALYKIVKNKMA